MKRRISPIEVKSSTRFSTVSLEKFNKKFGNRIGTHYVLYPGQLVIDQKVTKLPLYMFGLL